MKNILTLSLLLFTFLLNGCMSTHKVMNVSPSHLYNKNFGIQHNAKADGIIKQELLAMNMPTQIEMPKNMNPNWTTEISMDSDAFLKEDYVAQAPVITYKYKFDKKFYDKAEWRKASYE